MASATYLGAAARGFACGVAATLVHAAYRRAMRRVAPHPPNVYDYRDPEQSAETPSETIVRRALEGDQKGSLTPAAKKRWAQVFYYGVGGIGGALYGVLRERRPDLGRPRAGLGLGPLLFAVGDIVVLPLAQVRAEPWHFGPPLHAWRMSRRFVFGMALWGLYEVARNPGGARNALEALSGGRLGAARRADAPLRLPEVRRVLAERGRAAAEALRGGVGRAREQHASTVAGSGSEAGVGAATGITGSTDPAPTGPAGSAPAHPREPGTPSARR